ncbi:hypothetical protein CI102_6258 [Trichoderma harzianum]|uniref:Uncharacterized protein n=1 Tax=Trichoderma harzianum CBS 226.95 TaxID=983964 RepID=A0A2T4AHT6_TRIHA|nr:hypothetical protein M431DRAFT_383928 [Trichoderma harzianum CBS 226.95]PKK48971.1 hypothetical protein CI102_6258 [Trichoderma harzianum]PTB56655.1 hypothetical protein M431DRAFT_383928 [Trichoderma harzianum CBS 226.95]
MRTSGTGRPKLQTRFVLYQCLDSINLGRRRGIRVLSGLWQTGAATASWLGEESKGVRVGRLRWEGKLMNPYRIELQTPNEPCSRRRHLRRKLRGCSKSV